MKGTSVFLLIALVAGVRAQVSECPPEQEANWEIEMLLRHDDCHKFYKCTFGKPVEMVCPEDLYFNLDLWQCDWKENVDCEGRNDPALTTTTPVSTTTTTTTTRPTTTTTRPTTTTTRPTTTTTTRTTTTTTPRTTTTRTTTTPTTTTTTRTTTTRAPTTARPDFLENGCPVNPHVHWLLPHATNCNLFYYCVWGQRVLRQCPATLHFNPVLQVCDWPNNAGCRATAAADDKVLIEKSLVASDVVVFA